MTLKHWEHIARKTILQQTDSPNKNLIRLFNLNLGRDTDSILPGCHFTIFPNITNNLSPDGYDALWTPPEPFKNRMWKGGKIEFLEPLEYQEYQMTSTLTDVQFKSTSRGEACFTLLQKDIKDQTKLMLRESRTLVYLSQTFQPTRSIQCYLVPMFTKKVLPTSLMLFRFSATTFNSHLIHYDQQYCLTEGYHRPLVHGPLTVSLLLDFFMENVKKDITCFEYSCIGPAFMDEPLYLYGAKSLKSYQLWATNDKGSLVMKGTVSIK